MIFVCGQKIFQMVTVGLVVHVLREEEISSQVFVFLACEIGLYDQMFGEAQRFQLRTDRKHKTLKSLLNEGSYYVANIRGSHFSG